MLAPNRRILYYWSRTNGFFTRIIYDWRSTEGFVTVGAEQKDSLVLAPNRRILYCWRRTEGFLSIGAEQKDSLLLAPKKRILYYWSRTVSEKFQRKAGIDQESSVAGRGTSPSTKCPHVSVLTKESLLPPLLPIAPLTASLCIHLPFRQSADNHNGMQMRYLAGPYV